MTDTIGPVFVAGCPRSGTTALSWAIAAHPGYFTSAETHFYYYMLHDKEDWVRKVFDRSAGGGSWLAKHDIRFHEFLYYMGLGFDRMMRDRADGRHWIDHSPENVLVGEFLLAMFPTAYMFVVMRDPRSVCLSMLNSGFAAAWARDLDAAIREWNHYARAAAEVAAACPDRVMIVKQEDMRHRSAIVAAAVGERLNLGMPEAIAEFLATNTINSSFDKQTYADDSPFRSNEAVAVRREEFLAEHGERIIRETADLGERFGYA